MLAFITASEAAVIAFSEVGFGGWLILLMGGIPVFAILGFTYKFFKGDLFPHLRPADEYRW